MIDFHRKNNHEAQGEQATRRLLQLAARLVLWGCVLLLLIRGIVSVLDGGDSQPAHAGRAAVTVTQPVGAASSGSRR